jgi:hypothetical protein
MSREGENGRYWMNPRVCAPRLVPISHLELTDLAINVNTGDVCLAGSARRD